jgi:outer membrane protein assembly factor BamB
MNTPTTAATNRMPSKDTTHPSAARRGRKTLVAGVMLLCGATPAASFAWNAAPEHAAPAGVRSIAPLDSALAAPVAWRQFHGRPTHQGFNPQEQTVGANNVTNLSLEWIGVGVSSQFSLIFRSSPAIVGGFAYFGDTGGMLYAFRANGCGGSQCSPAWRAPLVQSIYNSPAVADGIVYVGTASKQGRLFAFDAAGCGSPVCTTPLWKSTHISILDSSPSVADGVVYVGSFDGGVHAFAAGGCGADECAPVWVGTTTGYVDNSPTVANGIVYAGDSDGKLYAFDAAGCGAPTCDPLWIGIAGAAIISSTAAVVNGVVYIGSFYDGKLNAFAAGGCGAPTCAPLWVGNAGTYVDSSPAVAYGRVYIGSGDAQLKVFDAAGCGQATCNPVWVGTAPGPQATIESSPMVANGVVYVGENNNRVYAFRAAGCGRQTCTRVWEFITQDPIVNSSPVLVNGTLYLTGTNFGQTPELYVFQLFGQ